MPARRLGELLVAEGLLTPAAVARALGFQRDAGKRLKLGSILLGWDLVNEENLLKALASLHRCEAVTGEMLAGAPLEVVRLLPAAHAIRLNAIPYALRKPRIRVAFVNPSDLAAIDEVSALTGRGCVPGVVTELRLMQAHRRFYGRPIPVELRPIQPKGEAQGPPRPAAPDVRVETPEEEIPVIIVPELPIPPLPAAARNTASREATAPAPRPASQPPVGPVEPPLASAPGPAGPGAPPNARSRGEIGDLAVASFPPEIPRVLLFTAGGSAIAGWRGRGVDAARVAATKISPAAPSLFTAVRESGAPHFGGVERELWPDPLARLLGADPPDCAVFPIRLPGGVAGFLYADREGKPMPYDDFALLARCAAAISGLLGRFLSPRGES